MHRLKREETKYRCLRVGGVLTGRFESTYVLAASNKIQRQFKMEPDQIQYYLHR